MARIRGKRRISALKRVISALSAVALLALTVAGVYVLRVGAIRKNGVVLRPGRDYDVVPVTPYLQNDPEWADRPIGVSDYRMGGAGCLVSSVASAMSGLGVELTPQDLNEKLTEIGGYQDGADLIWFKLAEAAPGVDYKYDRVFSSGTVECDLRDGFFPIVKVKYRGGGVQHWLLVVGAKDGEFLVLDPLNAEKEPIPLSTHGKVYAYRAIVPA